MQVFEFARYVRTVKPPKGWSNDQKDITNIVRKEKDGTPERWNPVAVDQSKADIHCMHMLFARKPPGNMFVMIVFPQQFCFYDDRPGEWDKLIPLGNGKKSGFEKWLSTAYQS